MGSSEDEIGLREDAQRRRVKSVRAERDGGTWKPAAVEDGPPPEEYRQTAAVFGGGQWKTDRRYWTEKLWI